MLHRVAVAGGFGTVIARGDATAGSIVVIARDRGKTRLLERLLVAGGGYEWQEIAAGEAIDGWVERARRRDPDLWVIELDIPDAARFVAETVIGD